MSIEAKTDSREQFIPATIQIEDNQTPLQRYLAEVNRYPVLPRNQYESLFRHLKVGATIDDLRIDVTFEPFISSKNEQYAYAFQQSPTLEELAFRCSLDLVVKEARRYPRFSVLDLIQEGNIGLMQAVIRHNPELGNFTSYARWWIRGAMFNAMPDLITSVHIPSSMCRRIKTTRDIETKFLSDFGQKPSEQQLRQAVYERIGLSGKAIDTVLEIISSGVIQTGSLDRSIAPGSEATRYDFIPDQHVDVEEEALTLIEDEEYRRRTRPSAKEVATNMGKSISTARKTLRRLVEAGLLSLHPRDPRTVDETGMTQHSRELDAMVKTLLMENYRLTRSAVAGLLQVSIPTIQRSITRLVQAGEITPRPQGLSHRTRTKDGKDIDALVEKLLQQDPTFRNKEIAALLAQTDKLGARVSTLTIARSRLRLAAAGKTERRILSNSFYRELDTQVEGLIKTGITYEQIAETLKQSKVRIRASGFRLRKEGRVESRAGTKEVREAVARYLQEHQGEKINRSEIARQFGITREWARQIYDDFQNKNASMEN